MTFFLFSLRFPTREFYTASVSPGHWLKVTEIAATQTPQLYFEIVGVAKIVFLFKA